ncbi:MAG: DNA/RNA non-specific endonuclease [Limisphaerales bacterium]
MAWAVLILPRGHLCPSEDRTDTRANNDMLFLMSNIMPQAAANNSGVWGQFEGYCRSLLSTNELLIVCGPSGFGTNRIPSGKLISPIILGRLPSLCRPIAAWRWIASRVLPVLSH